MVALTRGDKLRLGILAVWGLSWTAVWEAAAEQLVNKPWEAISAVATLAAVIAALYVASIQSSERRRMENEIGNVVQEAATHEVMACLKHLEGLTQLMEVFEKLPMGTARPENWTTLVKFNVSRLEMPVCSKLLATLHLMPFGNGPIVAGALAKITSTSRNASGLLETTHIVNEGSVRTTSAFLKLAANAKRELDRFNVDDGEGGHMKYGPAMEAARAARSSAASSS